MNGCQIKMVLLLAGFVLTACSAKPYIVKPLMEIESPIGRKIIVVDHGWHTGFVFPADDVIRKIPVLKDRFSDAPYLEFGWGDQGFYQATEKNTGLTMKAIFWPTDTVVHVVAIPLLPSEFYFNAEVFEGCISNQGYAALIDYVVNSFAVNDYGDIIEIKSGIYGNSQFYKGVGKYYLTNTCNKWTAKGLKSAGMDIFPAFKLTSGSIMNYLRKMDPRKARGAGVREGFKVRYSADCN